jgi:hypothetical protein
MYINGVAEQAVAFDAKRHSPPRVAGLVVRDTPSGWNPQVRRNP